MVSYLFCGREGSWAPCLNKFIASVQHVTGEILEARAPLEGHESILSEEMESLRASVDTLSQEVMCYTFPRTIFADTNE